MAPGMRTLLASCLVHWGVGTVADTFEPVNSVELSTWTCRQVCRRKRFICRTHWPLRKP